MISRGILSQRNEFIHDPSIYCRVRLDSRHAHNSLVDQSAVHECRVFPNGEVFAHFHDGCFCRVDGGEGCIEGEVEFLLAPGLAVLQPGELISVPEDELELESAFINRHAFPGIHLGVGGEEQLISAALLAHASESFWVPDDKPDVPLETLDVRHERVVLTLFIAAKSVHALHPAKVGVHGVYPSLVLLRRAPLPCLRPCIDIAQDSILPEPADHDEAQRDHRGDDLLRGVECIGHQYVGDGQQLPGVVLDDLDVPVVQVRLLSALAEVLREPVLVRGLHRPEGHALAPRGVDHADASYLEAGHDRLVAARPEPAHAPRALAGLGDVALVDGNGKQVGRIGEHLPCKVGVVGYPVDILREVVAVCLLAMFAVFPHLREIDFSH